MSEWISTFPGYVHVLTTVKKCFGRIIRSGPTPRHIGIIMDGNRRYAKSHKIEMKEGHNLGFELMANILELLYESGVESVTVYAFSIENFKRLKYEVEWLMELAKLKLQQLCQHGDLCEQYGIRIKILGNIALLPLDVKVVLRETEKMTEKNKRAVLNVCFPYTSRDEMTHAVKEVVSESTRRPNLEIDERVVEDHLYTRESPPLDILVRTSGTYRLSDFLLWQCVPLSCSVVFVDKLWPDFTPWDMCKVLINWGFNMYWYGQGNGPYTVSKSRSYRSHANAEDEEARSEYEIDGQQNGTTGSNDHLTHRRKHSNSLKAFSDLETVGESVGKKYSSGYSRFVKNEDEEDDDEDDEEADEDDDDEDDEDDDDDDDDDDNQDNQEVDTATSSEE